MPRIALDAMGGDYAPGELIRGAVAAAREGLEVVLVGNEETLRPLLPRRPQLPIVPAPQAIDFGETPTQAVLSKPNSSIGVGLRLVKEGEASAFVSAGSTGAVMVAALLILGKMEGIDRPALSVLYATLSGPALLLDAGANVDCRPNFLAQFARLGSAYMERVLDTPQPRVGLLSNAGEAGKGNCLVRQSFELLQGSGLNFVGNVEGNDMFRGEVQVVVTDGFTGNVVLKANEGFGEALLHQFDHSLNHGLEYQAVRRLLVPLLKAWKKRVDYSEYGGAPLLGVKGNVVIAHGRSRAKAIGNALKLAQRMVEQGLPQALIGGKDG